MYFILITGVIKVIMGREHKHARFCERDTRLCRLMEFYAEGFMKDEVFCASWCSGGRGTGLSDVAPIIARMSKDPLT